MSNELKSPVGSPLAGARWRLLAALLDGLLLLLVLTTVNLALESDVSVRRTLLVVSLCGFLLTPLIPWQGTPGQRLCRIKVTDLYGQRLTVPATVFRAALFCGWFILPWLLLQVGQQLPGVGSTLMQGWWVLAALPWVPIGFSARQQSWFDRATGSLVLARKADLQGEFAPNELATRWWQRLRSGLPVLLMCATLPLPGLYLVKFKQWTEARVRVRYAVEQTHTLREAVNVFYADKGRWPSPVELPTAPWHPYPAGGGYRLDPDGRITISFAVAPDLKGHSITLIPQPDAERRILWSCNTDVALIRGVLPQSCRH